LEAGENLALDWLPELRGDRQFTTEENEQTIVKSSVLCVLAPWRLCVKWLRRSTGR